MSVDTSNAARLERDFFYRRAMQALVDAEAPFMLGGAYALEARIGIFHRTKDLDIFLLESDVDRALRAMNAAGYRTEISFPHWLAKVFFDGEFVDVIYGSGNGVCRVDELWFQHATPAVVFDMEVLLCPIEETIWQKSFIMERDRCDAADVMRLLRAHGPELDWDRLTQRFAGHIDLLDVMLTLYKFVYPSELHRIPSRVWQELAQRQSCAASSNERVCRGTLLSATQYVCDLQRDGFIDARVAPHGAMTPADVRRWDASFQC